MKASELFEKILERPALYVGKVSIPLISAFVEGYIHAQYESRNYVRDELYAGFTSYVAKRFNIRTSHNWTDIVVFMGSSELGAYELAKELWTEYKENVKNQID